MTKHHEILGLKPTASQQEIEDAYQKLSKKFHPDNNDGDQYFSELFRNVKEAYEALSNKKPVGVQDQNLSRIDKSIDNESMDQNPKIIYFEANTDSFVEGDTIELIWKTRDADKIIIKPFGELEISGTRLFKLKNFNKPELVIKLTATNSISGKEITKTVRLKNKVTEVDFSELEEEESQSEIIEGKTVQQPVIDDEQIHSNSFAGAAFIQSQEAPVDKVEETFFSTSGRLRRRTYLGRSILLGIPAAIASAIVEDSYNDAAIGWSAVIVIICSILIFIQFIKRLHDINLSGWYSLINFIPYLGILFGFVVIFIDGSKGENNYGPDPKNRI